MFNAVKFALTIPSDNHIQLEAIIVFRNVHFASTLYQAFTLWFGLDFLLSSQYRFAIIKDHSWAEDR
jgi:hypothetical protein